MNSSANGFHFSIQKKTWNNSLATCTFQGGRIFVSFTSEPLKYLSHATSSFPRITTCFYTRGQLLKLLQLGEQTKKRSRFEWDLSRYNLNSNMRVARINAGRRTCRCTEPPYHLYLMLKHYSCFLQCHVDYNTQTSILQVSDRRKRKSPVY